MGKFKPKFGPQSWTKLTHTQCRAKVCIKCFQAKSSLRDVSGNSDWIEKFKENIGPNFDITNPRLPTGLCDTCTGASLPPRQPRQLPWLFFETIMNSVWQI